MKWKFTLLLAAALFLLGCSKKPTVRYDSRLFVISDSDNWQSLESTLREVFEKLVKTPQHEKVFEVNWVPAERFGEFATRKNLVILGILNSEGEINEKVSNMLSEDVKNEVKKGSAFFFPKEDPWAKQQLLVVLASNSAEELQQKLLENKEYLYELFEDKLVEDTAQRMYGRFEQSELGDELLEKYGWTLRIQHDYMLNIERPQDRFIMLRRSLPGRERWLFVHWVEDADPMQINEDWVMNRRDKLTRKFYENDFIDREHSGFKDVDFANRSTLMLEGLWANDEKVAGGPFRNYTFYDVESRRIYMIDVAVWYPGGQKEPFLRQLDIMAHTFKTEADIIREKEKEVS